MIVFYIVFRAFTVVALYFLGKAVCNIGLIDDRIAFVFLIGEDGLYCRVCPFVFALRRGYVFFCESLDDKSRSSSGYTFNRYRP